MAARLRFVDVAKGMSIVLVAFGHSRLLPMNAHAADLNRMLALFRTPFFFFLSGLFFASAKPLGTLVREKSDALLKPYVVTLGAVALVRAVVGDASLSASALRMAYGVGTSIDMPWAPLWYLVHLWLVFLYAWALVRAAERARLPAWASALLLAASTLVALVCFPFFHDMPFTLSDMHGPLDGLPFSADMLGISTTYFLLGAALRERVLRFRPNVAVVVTMALIFAAANALFHPRIELNQRIVEHPLATAACALPGIYVALSAAYLVSKSDALAAICAFFGFNALFIVVFHAFFEEQCRGLLAALTGWEPGLGIAGSSYVLSVVLAATLGALIRKTPALAALYLPRKHRATDERATVPPFPARAQSPRPAPVLADAHGTHARRQGD